jgi:hypothetical protein
MNFRETPGKIGRVGMSVMTSGDDGGDEHSDVHDSDDGGGNVNGGDGHCDDNGGDYGDE